jgi:hypothetical protein
MSVCLSVQIAVPRSFLLFSLSISCHTQPNGAMFAQAVKAVGRHFLTAN